MSIGHLHSVHFKILWSATDQSTIQLSIPILKLAAQLTNRQRTLHGWNACRKQVEFFASQTIRRKPLRRHFLARRLDRANHNRIRAKTFDLALRLVSNPLADRQQPNNASHANKDTEDRQ